MEKVTKLIGYLNNLQEDILSEQLALLPQMTALPAIYRRSNLNQKYSLFKWGVQTWFEL
jgi:hypothetical protein